MQSDKPATAAARKAVSSRLRQFVAMLTTAFATTPAQALEQAEIRARDVAGQRSEA